jgi:hypothetical protein
MLSHADISRWLPVGLALALLLGLVLFKDKTPPKSEPQQAMSQSVALEQAAPAPSAETLSTESELISTTPPSESALDLLSVDASISVTGSAAFETMPIQAAPIYVEPIQAAPVYAFPTEAAPQAPLAVVDMALIEAAPVDAWHLHTLPDEGGWLLIAPTQGQVLSAEIAHTLQQALHSSGWTLEYYPSGDMFLLPRQP